MVIIIEFGLSGNDELLGNAGNDIKTGAENDVFYREAV